MNKHPDMSKVLFRVSEPDGGVDRHNDMKCANCGLINPVTAVRCDCGYDFATNSVMDSDLAPIIPVGSQRGVIGEYGIPYVIAALFCLAVAMIDPVGASVLRPGLFVVAAFVGSHDAGFIFVLASALVIDALLYGSLLLLFWRVFLMGKTSRRT